MNNIADLFFHLSWQSDSVHHTDGFHAAGVNFWRDFLPQELRNRLMGKQPGDQITTRLTADEALEPFDQNKCFKIKNAQFDRRFFGKNEISPCRGRFYPKGILSGVANVFRGNQTPFRCGNVDNGHIEIDFNHPLAKNDSDLSVIVGSISEKSTERGGSSVDWLHELTRGPGMQAR